MELMAIARLHYAQRYGYGFTRFTYEPGADADNTCTHPRFGARHASWCKLLVIAKLLQELPKSVEHLVWLDSDTMPQQQISFPQFLKLTPNGCVSNPCTTSQPASECKAHKDRAGLLVASNYPSCTQPGLCAVQVWRPGTKSTPKLLQAWWNTNFCSQQFPWDQVRTVVCVGCVASSQGSVCSPFGSREWIAACGEHVAKNRSLTTKATSNFSGVWGIGG
jgi:hypothetical protein